jgi:hypothetical protein
MKNGGRAAIAARVGVSAVWSTKNKRETMRMPFGRLSMFKKGIEASNIISGSTRSPTSRPRGTGCACSTFSAVSHGRSASEPRFLR